MENEPNEAEKLGEGVQDPSEASSSAKYPASRMRGLKPYLKGQSGKPGRYANKQPKSLAAMVRASSKDGAELIAIMLQIARGKLKVPVYDASGIRVDKLPSHSDRMEAVRWLADRGFGKVTDVIDIATSQASGPSLDVIQAAAALARDI